MVYYRRLTLRSNKVVGNLCPRLEIFNVGGQNCSTPENPQLLPVSQNVFDKISTPGQESNLTRSSGMTHGTLATWVAPKNEGPILVSLTIRCRNIVSNQKGAHSPGNDPHILYAPLTS